MGLDLNFYPYQKKKPTLYHRKIFKSALSDPVGISVCNEEYNFIDKSKSQRTLGRLER